MNLEHCRQFNPGPGRWFDQGGRAAGSADLDNQFTIVDATLNSWKEAHEAFEKHQSPHPQVALDGFMTMRRLVHKVRCEQFGPLQSNTITSWPNEAITYALLQQWIKLHQVEKGLHP